MIDIKFVIVWKSCKPFRRSHQIDFYLLFVKWKLVKNFFTSLLSQDWKKANTILYLLYKIVLYLKDKFDLYKKKIIIKALIKESIW